MLKFMRIFAEDERFLQLDIKKNKPLAQIADEIEEEENMIQPIYQVVKDNPKATTEEIYQMINK